MSKKHLILMAIGCFTLLATLVAIFLLQIQVSTVLLVALFLLCPVLHLFMMRDHLHHIQPHSKESEI